MLGNLSLSPHENKNLLKSFLICAELEMLIENKYGVSHKVKKIHFIFVIERTISFTKQICHFTVSVCACIKHESDRERYGEIKRIRMRK